MQSKENQFSKFHIKNIFCMMSKSSRQHTASVNYKLCFKTSWFESHEIFFSIFWFILPQAPNVWEDELHNIVQMGLNSSISLDGQDLDGITRKFTHISLFWKLHRSSWTKQENLFWIYAGSLPPGHMKAELWFCVGSKWSTGSDIFNKAT